MKWQCGRTVVDRRDMTRKGRIIGGTEDNLVVCRPDGRRFILPVQFAMGPTGRRSNPDRPRPAPRKVKAPPPPGPKPGTRGLRRIPVKGIFG